MLVAGYWMLETGLRNPGFQLLFPFSRLHHLPALLAVLAANELVAQRFHFDGDVLDFLAVITPENERWDSDQQAHQRGVEDERDAAGKFARVIETGLADITEERHHPGNRSYQSEQRRDANDDLQHHQAPLQPRDLMPGASLDRVHVFRDG